MLDNKVFNSFYEYVVAITAEHNKMLNSEQLITSKNFISVHSFYTKITSNEMNRQSGRSGLGRLSSQQRIGRFGYILPNSDPYTTSHSGSTIGGSVSDNPNKHSTKVEGELFITNNLYTFMSNLKGNDQIESILTSLFIGGLDVKTYNLLYKEFLFKLKYIEETDDGYVIINKGKQKIKLGKLISRIIQILNINLSDKNLSCSIEKLVDQYKSWYKTANEFKFVVLKGDQVLNGYSSDSNSIRSCMCDKPYLLNLYTNNEDKILLLTVQKNDKIYGRCLIWKLDDPKIIFMDRVYGVDNYINNVFQKIAIDNGWSYRENGAYEEFEVYEFNYRKNHHKKIYSDKLNYKVKLNINGIKKFPYMDSFSIMSRLTDTFYLNDKKQISYNKLRSTDGRVSKKLKIFGIKMI